MRAGALLLALALAVTVTAADAPFRFVDVARDSGITLLNIAGSTDKRYLIDSTGNGAGVLRLRPRRRPRRLSSSTARRWSA